MKSRAGKSPVSQGIGESRRFIAEEGTFEPAEIDIRECHVGGARVADLPQEVQDRILYRQTDEGIEEYNAAHNTAPERVSVTSGEYDKRLQQRRDFRLDHPGVVDEAPHPMREVAQGHRKHGFRQRFLSDMVVKQRGMRDFRPVVDEKGDPVKYGGLVLGEIPATVADERAEKRRRRGNAQIQSIYQSHVEQEEREYRDAGHRVPSRVHTPEDVGLHQISGEEI